MYNNTLFRYLTIAHVHIQNRTVHMHTSRKTCVIITYRDMLPCFAKTKVVNVLCNTFGVGYGVNVSDNILQEIQCNFKTFRINRVGAQPFETAVLQ